MPVYFHHLVLVLAPLAAIFTQNQRKQVLGRIYRVLIYNILYLHLNKMKHTGILINKRIKM